jgi:hypothetical protein
MSAQGNDKRGQGGATAKIVSKLEALGEGRTKVDVDTDYHITGRLARFGRGGMIEDISERLLKEFASRLAASLEAPDDEGATIEIPAQTEEDVDEGAAAPESEAPVAAAEEDEAGVAEDEAPAPAPTDAPEPPPGEAAGPPPSEESTPPRPEAAGPPPPNEPLDAGSLVGGVLLNRIKANPWPLVGGAVLILLLRRRRR